MIMLNQITIKQAQNNNLMNNNKQSPTHKSSTIPRSPVKKTTFPYTQIIFEDDKLFHNIKVKGQPLHINIQKNLIKKRSKSVNTQNKQSTFYTQQNQSQEKIYESNSKFYQTSISPKKNNQKLSQKKFKRSITVQSVQIKHKLDQVRKSSQKLNKTDYNKNFQHSLRGQPHITYQKQNLNDQVYCSFKQMIDEFNKAKAKAHQRTQLPINKIFKQNYKKPNFYQYQQFYRQNYQAKKAKQTIFLFKKCDNSKKSKAEEMNKNNNQTALIKYSLSKNEKQQTKEKSGKKGEQVYVRVDFDNNPQPKFKKKQGNFPSYLLIKRHSLSKSGRRTDHPKKYISYFHKTDRCKRSITQYEKQHEEVSPWAIQQIDHPAF